MTPYDNDEKDYIQMGFAKKNPVDTIGHVKDPKPQKEFNDF